MVFQYTDGKCEPPGGIFERNQVIAEGGDTEGMADVVVRGLLLYAA
jgi:hypothetical protein